MKRVIISAIIVFIAVCKISAQIPQEIVYLKNGSVIRGIVLEQIPNQSVKVQTKDGSIFVYKVEEIEKISKDFEKKNNKILSETSYDLKGYRGFVDIGYIFGVGEEGLKEDRIEFSTTHGYQLNNHFFIGGGVGIHYMTSSDVFLLPMFVDFKGYLLNGNVSPFFDLKGGYSHILSELEDEDIKGGLYIAPSVGVRFFIPEGNIGLNLSLGFNLQKLRDTGLNEYANMNGVALKFGVEF